MHPWILGKECAVVNCKLVMVASVYALSTGVFFFGVCIQRGELTLLSEPSCQGCSFLWPAGWREDHRQLIPEGVKSHRSPVSGRGRIISLCFQGAVLILAYSRQSHFAFHGLVFQSHHYSRSFTIFFSQPVAITSLSDCLHTCLFGTLPDIKLGIF